MININKKFNSFGFIFFVFILYAENAISSTETQKAIRAMGIDAYISDFSKKPIYFLQNLQTKHVQINKRDLYYHTVFTDFEHQTRTTAAQLKDLKKALVPKVCSDLEIVEMLKNRANIIITFESPKSIALGGIKISQQTCLDSLALGN